MILKKLDINSNEFQQAFQIYESSIHKDERRDLRQIKSAINKNIYTFYAALDSKIIGMVTTWNFDSFTFIEHLAVDDIHRNKGYGTRILNLLQKEHGTLILEMEEPFSILQLRRQVFYEKAGFHSNPYKYLQPAYAKEKNSVPCLIMSYPDKLTQKEFLAIKNTIYKQIYNQ